MGDFYFFIDSLKQNPYYIKYNIYIYIYIYIYILLAASVVYG